MSILLSDRIKGRRLEQLETTFGHEITKCRLILCLKSSYPWFSLSSSILYHLLIFYPPKPPSNHNALCPHYLPLRGKHQASSPITMVGTPTPNPTPRAILSLVPRPEPELLLLSPVALASFPPVVGDEACPVVAEEELGLLPRGVVGAALPV